MVIMTKSPPWPCRVCFWACQNGGQAKSIVIKLVLQKPLQKWCYPPGRDDGATRIKGAVCLGPWGDPIAGQLGRHLAWPHGPSACPASSGLGAGWGRHSKDIGGTVLLPLRCSRVLEDIMHVHTKLQNTIFTYKHDRVPTVRRVLGGQN